ncbi:hypothetical protein OG473_39270 [Streptomyces anulatus]
MSFSRSVPAEAPGRTSSLPSTSYASSLAARTPTSRHGSTSSTCSTHWVNFDLAVANELLTVVLLFADRYRDHPDYPGPGQR